jgi:ATP-dependent Clp endopeptidase proteolytic subunit ClpP
MPSFFGNQPAIDPKRGDQVSDEEAPRTDAEIAATVAKTEAEAVKFHAEADHYTAQAEWYRAEARRFDAEARVAELEAEAKERVRRENDAADVQHHVYRFVGLVDKGSVEKCVTKLTEWHRLDPGCPIEVIFFSPGGDVISGFALFDHLRWLSSEGHKITTGCTGMAASMGGVLMQAGDHRWASGQAWYMIHRAAFGAAGKTFEVEDEVEWVKRIEKRIIDIFVARSQLTESKIRRNWDRKDWWLTADQCLELGLVDEIRV